MWRATASRPEVSASRIGVKDVPTADSTSRGVGAGRSAQRGTSGATTGPRGAAGPHNPEAALARNAPPYPDYIPPWCRSATLADESIQMRATSAIFGAVVLALLLVPLGLQLWLDARWFGAQGLEAIFSLRLRTQIGLGVAAAVLAGIFAGLNLAWAAWRLRRGASKEDRDSRGMATILAAVPVVALVVGLGFGLAAFGQWQTWLGYQAQVPFGQQDPAF